MSDSFIRAIKTFQVHPTLPDTLQDLKKIAFNVWWSWNHDAIGLFRRLDRNLWESTGHNPVLLLGSIEQAKLQQAAADEGFIAHLERVSQDLDKYVSGAGWFGKTQFMSDQPVIAYFSAEFGLTECLQSYSGGLGILAGDHIKSASDLGVPLVGVGLLYQQGYFQQYLNNDGWQQEFYPENDFYNLPLTRIDDDKGKPVTLSIAFPGRNVLAYIWRVQVGRISVYLLDTDVPQNSPEDRAIASQLYGGDVETRIKQEIVLGIGGMLALDALGINPTVCHMNEGHSAFLALERMRRWIQVDNISTFEAIMLSRQSTVFTSHTPVPAGIDEFPELLMQRYFKQYYPQLKMSWPEFLALGQSADSGTTPQPFNMAYLALRLSSYINGVSKLHGEVTRKMWQKFWQKVPMDEIPIGHVTNGIHTNSWISAEISVLFDRYLGPSWNIGTADHSVWARISEIPDEELWRVHERRRERLVAFTRRRLREQVKRRGGLSWEMKAAQEALNSETLTIGFARRFATYKRGTLLFKDLDRLIKILTDSDRPVQLIFAGKAHPRDNDGKDLIKEIIHMARREELRHRIVFLENYDIALARYLVQGTDIWLNTPRRPMEASGTSGMKVVFNGGINLSIPDGWWAEAYTPDVGWAIGRGEEYADLRYQDWVEANALYDVLEKEVVPLYYDRGPDSLPRGWIAKMKESMRQLCPVYNTGRMVQNYAESFYLPAYRQSNILNKDDRKELKALSLWRSNLKEKWKDVKILEVNPKIPDKTEVGSELEVEVGVHLGDLLPSDVLVEMYFGRAGYGEAMSDAEAIQLDFTGDEREGIYVFRGKVRFAKSGKHGFSVRIIPFHRSLVNRFELGIVSWADNPV
ncbi:MAG: alpha-glucan family phosphorylase [candidate division Zixibacteria bacterium]|nr:alpha-glucan family phosphorylase [candidate division Zixibacteria bacterium]MBU1470241.1 alpha-glucan family phosphorylase [candidate division Zixibacteria bacterium]MBU2626441.1 alpha-glucan family phosphorylase [candidate division Zixibacteria bacterium]